ncbi:VanZ family protein [Patescibacteria group bacterium]|nr:VanZ family protein [Patescibacteria group bacterium]
MKNFGKIKITLSAYLPPIIWAGLIFFLSNQSKLPSAPQPLLDLVFKQTAHVVVYAVLYFLIWRAINITATNKLTRFKLIALPLIITLIYALTDEFHQSFIPGREATWIDIAFDMLGASISHYLTHRQKEIHSGSHLYTK